ncbi:MAG: sporulation protein YqfC [Firmicutes bacterium]|nr:sporulation protein YqfC [Bacillota bacterium]
MVNKRLVNSVAAHLDLPSDILPGSVRLDLLGREHLRIVNHRGISFYAQDRMVIRLAKGVLRISGGELVMESLDDDHLAVEGRIDSLVFGEDSGDEA